MVCHTKCNNIWWLSKKFSLHDFGPVVYKWWCFGSTFVVSRWKSKYRTCTGVVNYCYLQEDELIDEAIETTRFPRILGSGDLSSLDPFLIAAEGKGSFQAECLCDGAIVSFSSAGRVLHFKHGVYPRWA